VSNAVWEDTVSKQYLVGINSELKSIKQYPLTPLDCKICKLFPKLSGTPWRSVILWVILTSVSTSEIYLYNASNTNWTFVVSGDNKYVAEISTDLKVLRYFSSSISASFTLVTFIPIKSPNSVLSGNKGSLDNS